MISAEEFINIATKSTYKGRIGIVVKFNIKNGKESQFLAAFQPAIDFSVKEKGCIKERTYNRVTHRSHYHRFNPGSSPIIFLFCITNYVSFIKSTVLKMI